MEEDKTVKTEAKRLVREFKKNEERGEFRNKLGRIWWPLFNRIIVPGASLCGILSLNVAGLVFGATLWAVGHPITKGFSVNVQNIAIKNAGILGRFLKQRQVPLETRREAVLEYLNQSGSWFFNRKWVRENKESIDKMAEGQKGHAIPNLVARVEYDLTRAANSKEKKQTGRLSLGERLEIYKTSYVSYMREKQGMKK